MCTVTYIPTGKKGEHILTSNRDEAPRRSSPDLESIEIRDETIVFPKDSGSNGTWIALSSSGRWIVVLNGAFEKHKHNPPYRKSRGVMALEYFNSKNAELFIKNLDLDNIEPFTFIIKDQKDLFELRWDGSRKFAKSIPTHKNQIWSSCTLYSAKIQEKRIEWFEEWIAKNPIENIIDFHHSGGKGDLKNGILMNRENIVQTTSITQIKSSGNQCKLQFHELLLNVKKEWVFNKNVSQFYKSSIES